jgi:anthranilate phosphoribosyltransferase
MEGKWTPSQIAALLIGLKMKGETVDEITGFVRAMRLKSTTITSPPNSVDTCGTGGDGTHTFNISTTAALIAASAGVPIAKHGNRSVSSQCGSADVLQHLGVNIEITPKEAEQCLTEVGIVFLFAPLYHRSMKHAALPRRELGVRTVFNILGPLSNPANTKRQLLGVFNRDMGQKMTHVLHKTGSEHVLTVHSEDGLDELSISGATYITELKNGTIQDYQITPESMGLSRHPAGAVTGSNAAVNADILSQVLRGKEGPFLDVALLNSGAAIYVAGLADSLREGIKIAGDCVHSGTAERKLAELVAFTTAYSSN